MSCVHEFSLRMHTYIGLQACFARKQTMLAGYEDRPHLIPASGRPPCGSVSAAGRRLYIAPACGRASVPYPGVRPRKRGRPAHALLACAAGLRRHLIPCERGEPCYMLYCTARTGLEVSFEKMKCHLPTRKIGDPLYTTFQKIFTIIRIFLKSEAPKAPGLFTFVHRGGLD